MGEYQARFREGPLIPAGDLVSCLHSLLRNDQGLEASLWKASKGKRTVFEGKKRGSYFQKELQIHVIVRVNAKLLQPIKVNYESKKNMQRLERGKTRMTVITRMYPSMKGR
ncbi:MAG: hypothetical protein QXU18_00045 [Thermoplasmatales archaeon]